MYEPLKLYLFFVPMMNANMSFLLPDAADADRYVALSKCGREATKSCFYAAH